MVDIILDAPVYVRMADGIPHVMAQKTADVSQSRFSLLTRIDGGKSGKAAAEEVVDSVLMHVGAYVPVVPVAQDGQVVEKDIRPLESQLVKPAVFGDNEFQGGLRQIVVSLHS